MDMAIAAQKTFLWRLMIPVVRAFRKAFLRLKATAEFFYRKTLLLSGYIPQITAIIGPTSRRAAVYSLPLPIGFFMVKGSSYMYITGPDVIKAVIGEEVNS